MKCMGERRYDSSCIQPCIIFGAGTTNCPRTEHVPAIEVLGRTVGRLRKQQAKVLASEIEMLLFFI